MRAPSFCLTVALALTAPAVWAQTTAAPDPSQPATVDPAAPPSGDATGSTTAGATTAGSATTGAGDPSSEPAEPPEPAEPSTAAAPSTHPVPQAAPLTPEAQAELGVAPGDVGTWPDPDTDVHRTLIPPFYLHERSTDRDTTAVFPFYFRDRRGPRTGMLAGPYYQLRSPDTQADVAFPVYWHWRGHRDDNGGEDWSSLIIPPFYRHVWEGHGDNHGQAFGVAPLFAYGESFAQDGHLLREHLVIPPLLTFHTWTPEHALTVTGPFFYNRARTDTNWGIAPLFFAGNDLTSNYLVIPALLTYHQENHEDGSALTVVGPFWTRSRPDGFSLNLAPLFFHTHDRTSNSTTLFPLLHLSESPDHRTVASPLWIYNRSENSSTFVTWLYQNHRGETNWDAVAPVFFSWRDPRVGAHAEAVLPFFYHRQSPAGSTWWVFPTFHAESDGHDGFFNAYPFVYSGRSGNSTHAVVAPFFWDFDNPDEDSHTTVVAPFFWRFRHHSNVTQLAGNVLWISSESGGVRSYEWHILPLFSYARPRPEDVSWNVLFGLAGYRRSGTHRQMRLFWIPIGLD